MIRVLVVDDSSVARELLCHILSSDPQIEIMAAVQSGLDALSAIAINKPDVITMDINMQGMDGYEATRIIMERNPIPIVIVSSAVNNFEALTSMRAMEAGALTVLPRPPGPGSPDYENSARQLIATVKTMAGVYVIRRKSPIVSPLRHTAEPLHSDGIQLVLIGASTGGPSALDALLKKLQRNINVPIAIVQHITMGFGDAFIDWLQQSTGWPTHKAHNGASMKPGHVYVAPDDAHLEIALGMRILISSAPPDDGLRPSVKRMFQSAAHHYKNRLAAVLLTGMGRDGADELACLKGLGALTFAQSEETCVVFGMPGEAVKLNAASYVLPPEQIAETLGRFCAIRPKPILI